MVGLGVRFRVGLVVFLVSLALPSLALAQGAFAGVVRDTSGAVLPGVTVEASSPALIEQSRTVATDGEGLYKIVDLRPGTYTVTFTLPGFNTFKRDGIEMSGTLTVNLNVELRVGALSETVTVTGQASTVDVTSVTKQTVLSRTVMDDIPVGTKTITSMGALIPGMVSNAQDVGGTGISSSAQISIHGSRGGEEQLLQDGMTYNTGNGRGGSFSAVRANEASTQEIAIETSGLNAESEVSGVRTNVIPKEGGNVFRSYSNLRYGSGSMQSNNLDDELGAKGILAPDRAKFVFNATQGYGGPIVRNTLWFYTAFQMLRTDNTIANVYYNLTPTKPYYTPDLSKPAIEGQFEGDGNLRMTWQINDKNKLNLFHQLDYNLRHHWYTSCGVNRSPEACFTDRVIPTYFSQIGWSSPKTSRLLLEGGAGLSKRNFVQGHPGSLGHDEGLQPPWTAYSYTEQRSGFVWGQSNSATLFNDSYQYNLRLAGSYVTGSHAVKSGITFYHAGNLNTQDMSGNGVTLQLLDGAARQVTQWAVPNRFEEDMKANIGIFVQDQWKVSRLSMNLGVRFDYQNMTIPENKLTPAPLAPNRNITFPEISGVPRWKNVVPRLGASYDLFGDGKTAVKVSLGKYLEAPNLSNYAGRVNPARGAVLSTTRVWTDTNGDFLPQCDFINLAANGECAVANNPNFGSTITTNVGYAPDGPSTHRGYNWEFSASAQQQLGSNLGVDVGLYRRWYGNFITTDNLSVTPANYSPYCITAPKNSLLPNGGGYQVCGLYDIDPALRSTVNNQVKLSSDFGKQEEVYTGVDVSANLRLPRGIVVAGGTSTGHVVNNDCFVVDSPQAMLNCKVERPFQTQVKGIAVYPLPWWGLQTSASFQSIPPIQITASYTATNAEIQPSLGRVISPGAGGTIANIPLVAPGTLYGDRLNQVDFRSSKSFRMSNNRRLQFFYDIYNVFNSNTVLAYNTNYTIARPPQTPASLPSYDWPVPTQVMQARFMKVGMQLDW